MKKHVSSLPGYVRELTVTPAGEVRTVFQNWVAPRENELKIYRSAQPNYNGSHDTLQLFSRGVVKWLAKDKAIKHIVSMNHLGLAPKVRVWLQLNGVKYTHVATEDFGVPDIEEVKSVCSLMADTFKSGGSVLVYCGFGQGRTGTMVTAYKIYDKYINNRKVSIETLIEQSTAEEDKQEVLLRDLAEALRTKNN